MSLVKIEESDDIILDIRYASSNNFMKEKLYENSDCYINSQAKPLLDKAVGIAKKQGYKLKIFDCFRPIETQQKMWNKYPDPNFLSNPETGSIPHCRGVAIDLTIVSRETMQELDMGTEFDEFSEKSHHDARGLTKSQEENRLILKKIMLEAGFDFYKNEWWHYQMFNAREFAIFSKKDIKA